MFVKFLQRSLLAGGLFLFAVGAKASADYQFNFFGFVKAGAVSSVGAVSSYGNQNHVAYTEATDVNGDVSKGQSRSSLQTDQSRFGFKVKKNKATLVAEFDMVDFSQSQSLGSAAPRIRLLNIVYALSDTSSVYFGEGWTHFYGVGPHTYNFVGHNYRSGNTGFLSRELAFRQKLGAFDYVVAVGKYRNTAASDGGTSYPTELSEPSLVLQANYRFSPSFFVGYAFVSQQAAFSKAEGAGAGVVDGSVLGHKLYLSYVNKLVDYNAWELKAEAYRLRGGGASNYFLNLSSTRDVGGQLIQQRDFGGFISLKYKPSKSWGVYGGYGFAEMENPETDARANQLVNNTVSRLGVDFVPSSDDVSIYSEFTAMGSDYQIATDTEGTRTSEASVVELGMLFKF